MHHTAYCVSSSEYPVRLVSSQASWFACAVSMPMADGGPCTRNRSLVPTPQRYVAVDRAQNMCVVTIVPPGVPKPLLSICMLKPS